MTCPGGVGKAFLYRGAEACGAATGPMNPQVQQALEILKSGEPRAFDQALETLQSTVYSFGMKVCGNREDAEDTAQETLLRLARQLKSLPNARALAVWLYKVAKTQCLMSRRKSKFAPAQMLSVEALMPQPDELGPDASGRGHAGIKPWQITPEEVVLRHEVHDKLKEAILSLPKPYRLVLILRDMEQLETREVAEVMGISEGTAKMRLHRARAYVRNALAKYVQSPAGRSAVAPVVDSPHLVPQGETTHFRRERSRG